MAMQDTLRALADPTRREILALLRAGPLTAGQIAEKFPVSAAAISRHLSVLKEADLVRDQREGKYIYYELNASVLEEILLWLTTLKGEEKDETIE
ncbi:autorepressor SdpR family transcription factor [Candidatus Allofournierella excrementigallinarum]|uniref:autorepressor SdpR family transcription factor n=1 Tax=Candidatus Allofournierella excrementigallinarum TaxID=2838592 RepID=UPI00374EB4C5